MQSIWVISDGKPGHLNQSLGLCDALQRLNPDCTVTTLPALRRGSALRTLLTGRWPTADNAPPQLVIGAGHRTHLSLLAAGRAFSARTLVLMKPSLPARWFDLCLIPEHDNPAPASNIITTRGALNRMQPHTKVPASGMLLIGGPSRHFGWDNPAMAAQIETICRQSPDTQWVLTTSRRTPADFLPHLQQQDLANLTLVPVEETGPGWLPAQLATTRQCWVSEESVSMVYESLTAGCATGLLSVPQLSDNRISSGLQQLQAEHLLTHYDQWQPGSELLLPATPFDEARRCADAVKQRLAVL